MNLLSSCARKGDCVARRRILMFVLELLLFCLILPIHGREALPGTGTEALVP